MARDLIKRGGIRAVEAFGDTRGDPGWHAGGPPRDHAGAGAWLPADFLLGSGFKTHRPHPRYPADAAGAASALTWRDEVEAALERLLGVVRPRPPQLHDDRRPSDSPPTGDPGR